MISQILHPILLLLVLLRRYHHHHHHRNLPFLYSFYFPPILSGSFHSDSPIPEGFPHKSNFEEQYSIIAWLLQHLTKIQLLFKVRVDLGVRTSRETHRILFLRAVSNILHVSFPFWQLNYPSHSFNEGS